MKLGGEFSDYPDKPSSYPAALSGSKLAISIPISSLLPHKQRKPGESPSELVDIHAATRLARAPGAPVT